MKRLSGNTRLLAAYDLIAEKLARVEEELLLHFHSPIPTIDRIGSYLAQGGGKRIRPALLLLSARLLGYEKGNRDVRYAAVIEFIHTATLVHDDIIDEARLRRGRTSANARWGNNLTVLYGDYLYTKSMGIALDEGDLTILKVLSDTTLSMIEGEIIGTEKTGSLQITREEALDIIRRKTADLFSVCLRIGAILGEAGEAKEKALASYGENLGICFQMVDDLLDFTADEKVLGKPVANDLREGKVTLPIIFLLRRSGRPGAEAVSAVLADRGFGRVSRDELLRLAREHGALDEARALAGRYATAARADLAGFERSPYREALEALPDFILARDH
jgi:octaprenyl-diphosphate synthase